jgi:hypothetical protein
MAKYPKLALYLSTAEERGLRDRNLLRHRNPWYKQERREPAPFLCTYMGRGRVNGQPLRVIWNKSDAVATNTYLMLYPRLSLATLMEQPGIAGEVFELLKKAARETMSEKWHVHAGGLHKIEPGELLEVSLPQIPDWLMSATMDQLFIVEPRIK